MKAPLGPSTLFSALQATLRARCSKKLNPAVKRWRYRHSHDDSAPVLAPETVRFLIRFGVLDAAMDDAARLAAFSAWLKTVSRAGGEAPGVVAAWLQLYATGEYGVLDEGICAAEPQCDLCGLKDSCRYIAAGGTDARAFGEDLARTLLGEGGEGNAGARDALRPADILAFLLYGEKGGSAGIARAEVLLKTLNGLRGVFEAPREQLERAGLNASDIARVSALSRLCKAWAGERSERGRVFRDGKDFFEEYHLRLRGLKQEVFIVAQLDQKNRLIGEDQVSLGTLSETIVHPREVFASAITRRAASIAVIHNHPSGDPSPSAADKSITRRLDSVAKVVGIRLLDHVIIGDGRYVSFVEENLLTG